MTDTNHIEIDSLEKLVSDYVKENFSPIFTGGGFGLIGVSFIVIPFIKIDVFIINFY